MQAKLEILYRSPGLLAIQKPPHLAVHRGNRYCQHSLEAMIEAQFGSEWKALHRLDRGTTGVLLYSDCPEMRRWVSECFAQKKMLKQYLLISDRPPPAADWTFSAGLQTEVQNGFKRQIGCFEASALYTRFCHLGMNEGRHLYRAQTRSGHTLQIRAHAALSGIPLRGDPLYTLGRNDYLDYQAQGATSSAASKLPCFRALLHAHRLHLPLPDDGGTLCIEAPLPVDMQGFSL